jgi:hypothetical protein
MIDAMLDAIKTGDAAAVYGLLDHLDEQEDERLAQVKKIWQEQLRNFVAEVGLLWSDYAPKLLYPNWRDGTVAVIQELPVLGDYATLPRCPKSRRSEVGSLVAQFARVLYRLGCCRGVEENMENGERRLLFWFAFRGQGWWCYLPDHSVTWKHRRPVPLRQRPWLFSERPSDKIVGHRYAQATALVRYVIASADAYLEERAARRQTPKEDVLVTR